MNGPARVNIAWIVANFCHFTGTSDANSFAIFNLTLRIANETQARVVYNFLHVICFMPSSSDKISSNPKIILFHQTVSSSRLTLNILLESVQISSKPVGKSTTWYGTSQVRVRPVPSNFISTSPKVYLLSSQTNVGLSKLKKKVWVSFV